MKVALYSRVSTSDQNTENQRLRLVEYAKSKAWSYDSFEETESTRKTRPVKQDLLQRLRNKEYDAVIIYRLDRWARSTAELILNTTELIDKGIGFISLCDNIDFTTAVGKLQFQILSSFAEFERSLIRERTLEGLRRARLQGKQVGRPRGRKDSQKRRKGGYILREARKRMMKDQSVGNYKPLDLYLDIN
jgi:DNA invertase Pin-like site-specific DNA recombinase